MDIKGDGKYKEIRYRRSREKEIFLFYMINQRYFKNNVDLSYKTRSLLIYEIAKLIERLVSCFFSAEQNAVRNLMSTWGAYHSSEYIRWDDRYVVVRLFSKISKPTE